MSEQRRSNPEEKQANAETIENTLDELSKLIQEGDIGTLPRRAKDVTSLFKSSLFRDDNERLWSYYQSLWDIIKEKWAQNAVRLSDELDDLEKLVNEENQRDFRPKSEEIDSLFKELRTSREDNEVLRQRFQNSRRVMAEKRKQFAQDSESNRSIILGDLIYLEDHTSHVTDPQELNDKREALNEIRNRIRASSLTKPHADQCWDRVRYAQGTINKAHTRLQEDTYDKFRAELSDISSSFNARSFIETLGETQAEWFDQEIQKVRKSQEHIKEQQRELKVAFLRKEQRDAIRQELDSLWQVSVDELNKLYEAKNEHHRQNHEAWREKTEGARDRRQEWLANNEAFIERLQQQAEELEEKIDSAWNEEFADKARGRLQGIYDKIAEVEQKNEQLRREIDDIEGRLNN